MTDTLISRPVALAAALVLMTSSVAGAAEFVPVPEDAQDGQSLAPTLAIEADGITATFTSEGGDGLAIAGKAGKQVGLGINGSKASAINVGETLLVTFDQDVKIKRIEVGYVGDEDLAVVEIPHDGDKLKLKLGGEAGSDGAAPQGVKIHKNFRNVKFNGKGAVTIPAGEAIRFTNESSTDNNYFVQLIEVEAAQG